MWPFISSKSSIPDKNPTREFMKSFKEGEIILVAGKECYVLENTEEWWDDEWLVPILLVGRWDDSGRWHTMKLRSRQVMLLCQHKE